jgi:putative flippase GtrA
MSKFIIFSYLKNNQSYIIRFILVGFVTFAINNLFFLFFNGYLQFNYQLSITFSYFLTVASHFCLNNFFTFSGQVEKVILGAVPRYLLMLGLNYLITLSVVASTVEFIGLSPYFGIVFSSAATAISSFLVMNHFVFRRGC